MDILQDILLVNKKVTKNTIQSFKKNWIIVFAGVVYMIISAVFYSIVSVLFSGILSILAGIVTAIFSAALISNFFYLLYNVINYDKVTIQDFKDGFTFFLRKMYTVFFLFWVVSYLLQIVTNIIGGSGILITLIINISMIVLLNALPETLYLKVLEPMDSIVYAFEFMKENWLNWLIPNVVLYGLIYILTGYLITDIFSTYISIGYTAGIIGIVKYIVAQILFSFTMIYRGHLYKMLSTSTRRKRMFMSKF